MNIVRIVKRIAIGVAALLALAGLVMAIGVSQPAQAVGKTELRRALLATVRVAVPVDGQKGSYSTGSGTVLTADGFILTNFHVMGDVKKGKLYNKDGLAFIGVNPSDLKGLPTWTYQAKLVKGDPQLDLAVLKVSAPFKGGGALPKNLGLTTMPIGDSDQVETGDAVSVIGYPGIGGDSVTYTEGTIAGFLDEDEDGVNDWFKTDAEVNKGNSGGAAINDEGKMIGVPTAGVSEAEPVGKLSLIRPINFAEALLKAAQVKIGTAENGDGKAKITSLIFTDTMDRSGKPGKPATVFPAGTQSIYAVFEYEGFTDGLRFDYAWTRDGKPDVSGSIDWEGGESGSYWVGITNKRGIIEGDYELTLSLDGQVLRKGRMTVGEKKETPTKPTFSDLVFAEGVSKDDKPVKPHKADEPFAEGTQKVYAFFNYENMEDGLTWSAVWYIDGEEALRREDNWQGGEKGSYWISIYHKVVLPNGHYKLELYVGEELLAEGEFDIGKGGGPLPLEEGVQVIGTIVDADTRRPIKGAVFIVLKPGVSARDFLNEPNEDDIYGSGVADSKGQFTLDALLERGETYSMVASAKGYQPAYQEDYTVDEDQESPLEVSVKLQKR
jgi:serine protease Do